MLVIGYKSPVDWAKVKASFKKCTNMTAQDIEKTVKTIKSGQVCQVENDFVLEDDLKELGILIQS